MSVNLKNANESTPLHFSVDNGHLDATKALVERGASINNTKINGATALMVAAQSGNFDILRFLREIVLGVKLRDF